MIIDSDKLPRISSFSFGGGDIDLELEDEVPELSEKIGQQLLFIAMYAESYLLVAGNLKSYEKVEADPDLAEQDIFSRVTFSKAMFIESNFRGII